ncbi:MAG: hypothetical protein S4CHLAM123_00720 [Chlamydiales bacterium]|nr:hypothetical protein [Chlamydiales bacterium]
MSINPIKSNLNIQANQPIERKLENLSLSSNTESTQPSTPVSSSVTAEFKQAFRPVSKFNIESAKNQALAKLIPPLPNESLQDIHSAYTTTLMHADLLFLRFLKDNKSLCTKRTGSLIQFTALIIVLKYNHDHYMELTDIQPASISLDRLKSMERLFLKAIDWNVGVNSLEDLNSERAKIHLALKKQE